MDADFDTVVVGAGVSGLYAAWRCIASGRHAGRRVVIFESDRVGGRVYATAAPAQERTRLDLGAMRFVSDHVVLGSLLKRLGLHSHELPHPDPEHALFYVRGRRFQAGDLHDHTVAAPYELRPSELYCTPDDLFYRVASEVAARNGSTVPASRRAWADLMRSGRFDGTPLWELGFWTVASEIVSHEAAAFMRDGNGYDCNNWSTVDVLQTQIASFGSNTSYCSVDGGFGRLTDCLRQQFEAAGGRIESSHRVSALEVAGDAAPVTVTVDGPRGPTVVRASRVIVAVPPRAHSRIAWRGRARDLLDANAALVSQPSLKVFLGYRDRWWIDAACSQSSGRFLTDLPIRLATALDNAMWRGEASSPAVLLVSCNDDRSFDYFAPRPDLGRWTQDDANSDPRMRRIVAQMNCQLSAVTGIEAPEPAWAVARDWTVDPFGGAYHGWRPGIKPWEVAESLRSSCPNVHVCGSAYSDLPTWVEGALCNTEQTLQHAVGIPAHDWLPPDSFLGW
jgi:lysine 2-monooxygenase